MIEELITLIFLATFISLFLFVRKKTEITYEEPEMTRQENIQFVLDCWIPEVIQETDDYVVISTKPLKSLTSGDVIHVIQVLHNFGFEVVTLGGKFSISPLICKKTEKCA